MATIYKTDRTIEQKPMTELKDFQSAVGGYIEVAGNDEQGRFIIVNEEGLIKGLPVNPYFPWLVGNVVVATDEEFN